MADWTEGYISDINYTYGYYPYLNPNSVIIPFLRAGLEVPKFSTACELGFGQGISINTHAAASDIKWYGTDFNPAHASFAQEIADITDSDIHISDESFSEFCSRSDLPDFDFIGLHGIWSWISDDNRHIITDFLRRKLKVGGVLYISYNTLPGWSATAPIRHMLNQHDHMLGSRGQNMKKRVQASMDFTQNLLNICQPLVQQSPLIPQKIEQMQTQDRNYLAHEYFNSDWQPMYFSELSDWLSPTKATFACSPNVLEDFPHSNFTDEQLDFLNSLDDPMFIQSVKDYMRNTQFRQDFWVKGARNISTAKLEKTWQNLRFLMISNRQDITLNIEGNIGTIELLPNIYEPILDILADYKIHQVADIEQALPDSIKQSQLFEALSFLKAKNNIILVQDEQVIETVRQRCEKLNHYILQQSLVEQNITSLVSPLTGGAFSFSQFDLIFLHTYQQGKKSSTQLAEVAWQVLTQQSKHLVKKGKDLQTEEENLAELNNMATNFISNTLPLAKRLQIITD
ncbi:methyltransferase regulatory domain-containing protein [Psychrobacter sp. I-STPA6b]|uniref:methyltransferase regulatory domain-containing protein n=1 Tax=Psychrobacter sp. I-STPA6b TaxID=2585718 RepID=UPI001D0BF504|nr:methyltransferase regulatory domain-containing protein [Psychrobacter sp. I-STPA6b]